MNGPSAMLKAHNGSRWVEIGTLLTCEAYEVGNDRKCPNFDKLKQVTLGCVHEHLGQRWLCPAHLGDVELGWHRCGNCESVRLRLLTRPSRRRFGTCWGYSNQPTRRDG